MRPLIPLIFDPIEDDSGTRLPFSRFDVAGCVIVAFSAFFTVLFVAQGSFRKAAIAFFIGLIPIPLVESRRFVILCGLAVGTYRFILIVGATALIRHPVWTVAFVLVVFLCLRGRRP